MKMIAELTYWCRPAIGQHQTCGRYGAGRGIPCACPCHTGGRP